MTSLERVNTSWTLKKLGLFFATYFLVEVLVGRLLLKVSLNLPPPETGRTSWDYYHSLSPLIGGTAGLAMVLIWRRRVKAPPLWNWRELLKWQSWTTLVAAVGLNLTVVFLYNWMTGWGAGSSFPVHLQPPGMQASYWIGSVLVVPALEEQIFRGILQPALRRRYGPMLSIGVVALLFAAFHAPQVWPKVFLHGVVWGYVAERQGSVTLPALAHAVFNAVMLAIS